MNKQDFENLKNNIIFNCLECKGTGWINDKMCSCLKKVKLFYNFNALKFPIKFWEQSIEDSDLDPVIKSLFFKITENLDYFPNIFITGSNIEKKYLFLFFIVKRFLMVDKKVSLIKLSEINSISDQFNLYVITEGINNFNLMNLNQNDRISFIKFIVFKTLNNQKIVIMSDLDYSLSNFLNDINYSELKFLEISIK